MTPAQRQTDVKSASLSRPYWIALLVVINVAVFSGVQDFDFLNYDDPAYVYQNPQIQDGLTADGILWALQAELIFPSPHADYWQPVTFLSRMLDISLFGMDPGMHHLVNLFIHILNTLLLFLLLARMTGREEGSFWVAALFAIHPLHVESVAWVTERKDVLFVFFWLLAMLAYTCHVNRPRSRTLAVVTILFACSLMSKPMAVTLPCVLLLMDFWPLQRAGLTRADLKTWGRLFLEKVPLFICSGVMAYIAARSQFGHLKPHSAESTMAHIFVSYARYLQQMVWPVDLAIHYPYSGPDIPLFQRIASLCLILGISLWSLLKYRRAPYLIVGWLWYLGTLAPVMGLNDIAGADRFTYLPLIGIFVMIVWWGSEWVTLRIPLRILGTVVGLGFMGVSWNQTTYWFNSDVMVIHWLQVSPKDWVAHHQMGIMEVDRGELDSGEKHLREAIRLQPDYADAHYNLGIVHLKKNQYPEAIEQFKLAFQYNPTLAMAMAHAGDSFLMMGQAEEARPYYFKAIQLQPAHSDAHHHLALCMAVAGRWDLAEKRLLTAYQLARLSGEDGWPILADLARVRAQRGEGASSTPLPK